MAELSDDLKKDLINFQRLCSKFGDDERNNKELSVVISHLKHANESLKEKFNKSTEQIKSLRQICNDQVKKLSELYHFKKQNEILNEEINNLENCVQNLKEKITAIEVKSNEVIEEYIFKHKVALENHEEQFNNRERELHEKLEVLQASFDLAIFEKNVEMKNLKTKCNQQLTAAVEKEQQLKNELYRLNNQSSSSTAVLQKKILELEQKVKSADRDKTLFNISKGNFISANNVLKKCSNVNQVSQNTINNNSQNQSQYRSSIERNVSRNIEKNTTKKFRFRKSHFLSESFDPFEMNKQINSNNQAGKQNNNSSAHIIDENSENSTASQENLTKQETEIDELNNELRIIQETPATPVKKRKLFNPRNMDYLN